MRDKRIKLVFFSFRGSEVRDFDISWQKIIAFLTMFAIILVILVVAFVGLFTSFYNNSKLSTLQQTNQILNNQLGQMREKIDAVSAHIGLIEVFDNDQRVIAGLDEIDKDMRMVGRGGPYFDFTSQTNALPRETRNKLTDIKVRVDQLERRIELAQKSQSDIETIFTQKSDKLLHLPTINPVRRGRITDRFGNRIDPFIERPKQHTGIDIAAPIGTPVYAAAHGYVESVHHSYNRNNYGKYVVIDHGYGKQTYYAHLSKIFVKPGQQVKRWDIIGAVGQTGRATGPHLHYEVREDNTPVNPINYFFE
jgi:murein DD-endopeptidase MepM/ murein hydrolase activator NlpD